MSKINDLIKELCPNGVKYKNLEDLIDYVQPTRYIVNSTDYDDNYRTPVLTAGQTFILGYTNETEGVYLSNKENPVIIFDDFTTSNHWVDFNFKVKSSALKILIPKTKDIFKYIYYCISNIDYSPKEHSRQWIQTYSKFLIPLPPTEIQEEIVRILDKFGELEAELEARKSQYEFWRGKLLNNGNYNSVKVGDISYSVSSGKCISRNSYGLYPVYGSTGIIAKTDEYLFDTDKLLIARVGANAGYVHVASGKYNVTDNTLIVDLKENIDLRFMYYFLQNYNLNKLAKGGGQSLITGGQIKELEINLPPLTEQKRISNILDKFDTLINDISIGLPAEIELRRKQYEYYRNKLLSFEGSHYE